MNAVAERTATSAELVVKHLPDGSTQREYHAMNACGDVIKVEVGDRAMTLAFLARRNHIKLVEVHVGRRR